MCEKGNQVQAKKREKERPELPLQGENEEGRATALFPHTDATGSYVEERRKTGFSMLWLKSRRDQYQSMSWGFAKEAGFFPGYLQGVEPWTLIIVVSYQVIGV